MFAGAVRETVFSRPEIIKRVNAEFIPVAVRAADVARGGPGAEGRLLGSLRASQPAPQGLAVLNSDGQPLDWVLMFDTDKSVEDFLTYGVKRYREHPDGHAEVVTRRYMRYPGTRRPDASTAAQSLPLKWQHGKGERCPGSTEPRSGALTVSVHGRALDKNGKPVSDTLNQKNYAQDEFVVPEGVQRAVARALLDGKPVPEEFGRLCVRHTYLGMLDVQPLENPSGGTSTLKTCRFDARKIGRGLYRIDGHTDVESALERDRRPNSRSGDGRSYEHKITLTWEGYIEVTEQHLQLVVLKAEGTERLKWGSRRIDARQPEVTFLPAGRPLDFTTPVRYGLTTR